MTKVFNITVVLLSSGPEISATSTSRRASSAVAEPDHIAIPIAPHPAVPTQRPAATNATATRGTAAAYAREYAAAGHGASAAPGMVYDGVSQLMEDFGSYLSRRIQNMMNRTGNTRGATDSNQNATDSNRNSNVVIEINQNARPEAPAAVSPPSETASAAPDDEDSEESSEESPLAQRFQKIASAPELLLRRCSSGSLSNIFCRRSSRSRVTPDGAAGSSSAASSAAFATESNNQKPGLLRRRATAGDAESLSLAESKQQAAFKLPFGSFAKVTKPSEQDEFFHQCMFCLCRFGDTTATQKNDSVSKDVHNDSSTKALNDSATKVATNRMENGTPHNATNSMNNGTHSATNSVKNSSATSSGKSSVYTDEEEDEFCQKYPALAGAIDALRISESLDAQIQDLQLSSSSLDCVESAAELGHAQCRDDQEAVTDAAGSLFRVVANEVAAEAAAESEAEDMTSKRTSRGVATIMSSRRSVSYEPTIITRCGHKFHVDCLKKHIRLQLRQKMQENGSNPLADTEENNRQKFLIPCPHPFCNKKISKKWAKENGFLEQLEMEMTADENARQAELVARLVRVLERRRRFERCQTRLFITSWLFSAIAAASIVIIVVWFFMAF